MRVNRQPSSGIVKGSGTHESAWSRRQAGMNRLYGEIMSIRCAKYEQSRPDRSLNRLQIAFKSDPEREKRADVDDGAKSSSKGQFDDIVKVVSG